MEGHATAFTHEEMLHAVRYPVHRGYVGGEGRTMKHAQCRD